MYDPTRPPLPPDMMQIMSAPQTLSLPAPGQLSTPQGIPITPPMGIGALGGHGREFVDMVQAWLASRPEDRAALADWRAQRPDRASFMAGLPAPPPASGAQPLPAPVTPGVQTNPVASQRPLPQAMPSAPQQFDRNPYSSRSRGLASKPSTGGGFFGTGRGR